MHATWTTNPIPEDHTARACSPDICSADCRHYRSGPGGVSSLLSKQKTTAMAIAPVCVGAGQMSAGSQHLPTCMSAQLLNRRPVLVRHLGSRPAISTREALAAGGNTHARPALPRNGRLTCQAFRQTEVTAIQKTSYTCTWCFAAVGYYLKHQHVQTMQHCNHVFRSKILSEGPGRWTGCRRHLQTCRRLLSMELHSC